MNVKGFFKPKWKLVGKNKQVCSTTLQSGSFWPLLATSEKLGEGGGAIFRVY